jgi:very-short-patch-repair endonuclease
MTQMRQTLQDHLTRLRLDKAVNDSNECLRKLARHSGPVVDKMSELLRKELGNDRIEGPELAQSWGLLVGETSRLGGNSASFRQIEALTTRIAEAGAAKWAKALRVDQFAGDHDVWLPPTWLEAWTWRQAATFVDSIDGRKALRTLQTQRKSTEEDLARAYQKLVENKTWLEVYNNSPPAIKAALQAYLNAIRRIGKGTGIRAVRFRKEARAAMLDAYRAVPCWILPQWRVSETLPPEIGRFDLVIIDEASQSDIWALPALIRGAKLMVVGDDKQVSPDGIGLAEERIKDLKNRFLKQQIHGNQMTPEKSLYDLAKVVFAGEMVMLREHFRCVAPIIEFSKREFYNHEIRPLRIPKGSERLDPPLIDVFVRGGSRSGKTNKVNQAEARAIVDEMKTLIGNPRYDGRSMGVVSLLGIEQAHRIFELIREEVPPEEVVGRKITVGDARTFQGKERDIMFLSMVATPDENTAATAQMFEQRFNVAASRARDRMYLFRSVEVSDLSKVDLKARLIEHFRAPFHQDPVRVASLRELCESDFERDMFDVLTKRNYQVQPQVQVGGYRIDLVVNGHEDRRLAIECDGDKYHGPEQWAHDMARQRILERAGWTFWRCFGASFFRNREATLDDLLSTLAKMGIEPIGAAELDLGRYTEHREVSPLERTDPDEKTIEAEPPKPQDSPPLRAPPPPQPPQRTSWTDVARFGRGIKTEDTTSVSRKREILSVLAGSPDVEASTKAVPETDLVEKPRTVSLVASVGKYSDAALADLLGQFNLKSEDKRGNGGALWVYGDIPARALKELKAWGFQYAPTRAGWWKK